MGLFTPAFFKFLLGFAALVMLSFGVIFATTIYDEQANDQLACSTPDTCEPATN